MTVELNEQLKAPAGPRLEGLPLTRAGFGIDEGWKARERELAGAFGRAARITGSESGAAGDDTAMGAEHPEWSWGNLSGLASFRIRVAAILHDACAFQKDHSVLGSYHSLLTFGTPVVGAVWDFMAKGPDCRARLPVVHAEQPNTVGATYEQAAEPLSDGLDFAPLRKRLSNLEQDLCE